MDPVLSGALSAPVSEFAAAEGANLSATAAPPTSSALSAPALPASPSTSTSTTATLPSIPATLPRDCKDLVALLQSMGLAYHPSILPLLLDHYHQLTAALVTHIATTSQHTHRTPTDASDVSAIIASFAATSSCAPSLPPPIELMLPLAVHRNAVPLPLLRLQREKGEVMLPPDRFLLTHRSWQADVGHSSHQQRVDMDDGRNENRAAATATTNINGTTVT